MSVLIVTCAACGKHYKGSPGPKKYKCSGCGNHLTFPGFPQQPAPGKVLCSCCWTELAPRAGAVFPCPGCGQKVSGAHGGTALAKKGANPHASSPGRHAPGDESTLLPAPPQAESRLAQDDTGPAADESAQPGAPRTEEETERRKLRVLCRKLRREVHELRAVQERLAQEKGEHAAMRRTLEKKVNELEHKLAAQDGGLQQALRERADALTQARGAERAAAPEPPPALPPLTPLTPLLGHAQQQAALPTFGSAQAQAGQAPPLHGTTVRLPDAPPPSAEALLGLKHFALRDNSANATILAALHLPEAGAAGLAEALQATGFLPLPPHGKLNQYQRAILHYLATLLKVGPGKLTCGAKNIVAPNIEGIVGHVSSPELVFNDLQFEPQVASLRAALSASHPHAVLHYLCLPPLDIRKLTLPSQSLVLDTAPPHLEPHQDTRLITERWLRGRTQDLAFVAWVAKRWPEGGTLPEVLAEIEYADWMVSLLAYTRYPAHTLEGKRMLVKLACLCATRAQRWTPSIRARTALGAAERWLEDPSAARLEEAGKAALDLEQFRAGTAADGPLLYVNQAVADAALRAARAAHSTDPSYISSCAARAAAAAVMAASFAASASRSNSWLVMVNTRAVPDEAAEHRELCRAIRTAAKSSTTTHRMKSGAPAE